MLAKKEIDSILSTIQLLKKNSRKTKKLIEDIEAKIALTRQKHL